MKRWHYLALCCAAQAGVLLAAPAAAQEQPGTDTLVAEQDGADAVAQQTLYLDALQALAEGRKKDASRMLSTLIDENPKHAGAWLDLALIQCGLGYSDEAERLFANIETRFPVSRDLLELIAQTREAGCTKWTPASSTSFVTGRGVDQNVNQGTFTSSLSLDNGSVELPLLPDFLPKHDQYTVFGLQHAREITRNGSVAFVQFQQRVNDRLHDYDNNSLFAGIESPYQFGKWAVRTSGLVGAVGLGGRLYQRQMRLQAQVTPPLHLSASTQFSVLGSVSRTDYMTLTNFNSNTFELRGQLSHRFGQLSLDTSLGALSDRARDERPGGNRHGGNLSVALRRPFGSSFNAELAFDQQTWSSALPYSPELFIDQVRSQRTQVVRAAISYRVNKNQSIILDARAVRNRENISIFEYNNRLVQLSWQWQR
jgi:hypothetical protein